MVGVCAGTLQVPSFTPATTQHVWQPDSEARVGEWFCRTDTDIGGKSTASIAFDSGAGW